MIFCGKATLTKPAVYCLNDPFCGKTGNGLLIVATVRKVVLIETGIRDTFQAPVFQYRLRAR